MKLFVNLDPLHPPLTGIGQYTYGILDALQHLPQAPELCGQYQQSWYQQTDIQRLLAQSAQPIADANGLSSDYHAKAKRLVKQLVKRIPASRGIYRRWQSWRVAGHLTREITNKDVYWEPNYALRPFSGISVPTIHDIAYIRRPEFHERSTIDYLSKAVPQSIAQAAHLFTVSEFSRREIIDHYQVAEAFVSVIYPGVSTAFRPHNLLERQQINAKYQLPEQFILSLGTLEPRKNLKGLMQAYLALPEALKNAYPLVLVGAKGWLMHQFAQEMQQLKTNNQLIVLGYVPQVDLPALISSATVMVYVSHYEGFGMPVAEAMASGTAVLTSLGTSMQEIVQDTAQLVNPLDADDIAQGLCCLLENSEHREALTHQALARVKQFSWSHSAEKMLNRFAQLR